MMSNHGGRQLDGPRSPFDQLADRRSVGDRIDVICDGGITRGTHVLKALSVGAKACLPAQEGLDRSAVYFVCGWARELKRVDDERGLLASCKAKGATMRVGRRLSRATEKSRSRIASSSIVT
jgi:L-lactate dehydrogenase (cytochrome)